MKVPNWAVFAGGLMILCGGCGVLNNVQKINSPKTLEKSSAIFSEVNKELERAVEESKAKSSSQDTGNTSDPVMTFSDSQQVETFETIQESVKDMMTFSDYYKKWVVRIGYIGVLVSIFFAIAGVLLVMGKPYAIKLTYIAIALSMAALLFQIIVISLDEDSGMIAGLSNIGAYFMVFINVILLVIVLASDKEYFYQAQETLYD